LSGALNSQSKVGRGNGGDWENLQWVHWIWGYWDLKWWLSYSAVTLKLNFLVHGHIPLPSSPLIFVHSFEIHHFLSLAMKWNFPGVIIAFQCVFSRVIWLLKIFSKMEDI
jgi:hypothetical protein